jgi:hypothetical protein
MTTAAAKRHKTRKSRKGKAHRPAEETSAKKLARWKRCLELVDLRIAGNHLHVIGASQTPPISGVRVYQIITETMAEMAAEKADEVRRLENMRLDDLQTVWWPRAMEGDPVAFDKMMQIMRRRAQLMGVDIQPDRSANLIVSNEPDQVSVVRVEIINNPFVERVRWLEANQAIQASRGPTDNLQ